MGLTFLIPTLDQSGAEKQLSLLACGLKQQTIWDLDVVALTRGGPFQQVLEANGVPVTILNKRGKIDPFCWRKLRAHLKSRQPDLLHTWMFTANAYGRLAAGRKPAFRTLVSERCVDSWKSHWQRQLDRRLIARTDRLLANSEPVAEFYRELGYPEKMISVIPNGVEVKPRDEALRKKLLAEWKLPVDARIVGYVGRLAPQKRVRDLIWAFQLFRQLTDNVYFVIAGDGPARDDLQEFAAQARCDHLIRFVGHRAEGAELMNAFDQFWLASDFEGMPNSLMEALAAGVPSIASDIPANRQLIAPGETGELFPVGDSLALAQLADRLLSDTARAAAMSERAVRQMSDEFSIPAMIDRHQALYEAVLSSPSVEV